MSDLPKISIVTPNFNGARHLEQTILSVLGQNYPALEYIVIDGGSTDGSMEIIRKYESRLAFWCSEPDEGMYHAILKGFRRSSGEVMAWLNADDMYHPGALSLAGHLFSTFRHMEWLTGCQTWFDVEGRTVRSCPPRPWTKYDFYRGDYRWIQQESTFWTRRLWDLAGARLDTGLKYAGDFELWLRFFAHAPLHTTNALLGGFRLSGGSQLSVRFRDEYIREVESCLARLRIPEQDQQALGMLESHARRENILKRLRIDKIGRIHKLLSVAEPDIRTPAIEFDFERGIFVEK